MSGASDPRILIVEDDGTLAFLMDEICTSAGLDVVGCVADATSAMELIRQDDPNLLLLDFNLEGQSDGLELISKAKAVNPALKSVLVTGWDINDIASRLGGEQPDRILRKPVKPHVLLEVIDQLFARAA